MMVISKTFCLKIVSFSGLGRDKPGDIITTLPGLFSQTKLILVCKISGVPLHVLFSPCRAFVLTSYQKVFASVAVNLDLIQHSCVQGLGCYSFATKEEISVSLIFFWLGQILRWCTDAIILWPEYWCFWLSFSDCKIISSLFVAKVVSSSHQCF